MLREGTDFMMQKPGWYIEQAELSQSSVAETEARVSRTIIITRQHLDMALALVNNLDLPNKDTGISEPASIRMDNH